MKQLQKTVDLRSDTVTRPSAAMRQFMAEAAVGDDVLKEDPTVNELEKTCAQIFGKEAALFVPTGTMANQIAVRVYGKPGDEFLVMDSTHVFYYEGGGAAANSGVQLHPVPLVNGMIRVSDFFQRIRRDDPHFPITSAFWIENTHNRGGGRIFPFELQRELFELAVSERIPLHVDGARIANASIATGIPLHIWGSVCDSLSLCFSKGLGAPVGSVLLGSHEFIRKALRVRKTFGGGMRQAGIIAAGALYALHHNLERLVDDHARAVRLRNALKGMKGIAFPLPVETNIVMIDIDPETGMDGSSVARMLADRGILIFDIAPFRLRAVTHLDVDDQDIENTINAFSEIFHGMSKSG